MKIKHLIVKSLLAVAVVSALALVGGVKHASADANCVPYNPNTIFKTPIFNHYCDVPNGVGDEPDFVRVRQDMNGNNEDNQNNPLYTGGTLNAACNDGDIYDVWTYVHNDAASAYNDNGNGSAVAHNVNMALTANKINQTGSSFMFSSSVSASDAAGVQDNTTLNCGSKTVKLTLVPNTVHTYSQQYNWHNLADSSVNSTFKIGSPNLGSGVQWGCAEYRIVVVYTVKVENVTPPPAPVYSCDMLTLTADANTARRFDASVTYTAKNGATFKSATFDWGDGSKQTVNGTTNSHTYAADNTYIVSATVT